MIKIENLEFNYPKYQVFKDITLTLEEGKIYGLLGQNGVGKTTLMKIIAGLLKSAKGDCNVNGVNPFKREPSFLQDIYFIPEDFTGPNAIVQEYAKNTGEFYPRFDMELFHKLMSEFEVNPLAKFTKLSFGQQKKAIISLALALRTKILLLDEPSNGLDIPSKTQLRRLIAQYTDEESTVIISTHQVRDLENLIDPIIILDRQKVLINASIEEISEKLHFSLEPEADTSALYCEPVLGGYAIVRINTSGMESKVNIETLFNCVLNNKEYIKSTFQKS